MKMRKTLFVLALMFVCATAQAWDEPVSITATSQLYSADTLITSEAGSVTSYKDTYNANFYGTDGWLFNYNDLPGSAVYDFGSSVELSNIVLWNWSGDWQAATNRGAKDFSISFSNDGSTYTNSVSFVALEAISSEAEPAQVFTFSAINARYAKITVTSNHGAGDWVGIGELHFNDTLVPMEAVSPADGALNVQRDPMLQWAPFQSEGITGYDVYFSTDPNTLDPNIPSAELKLVDNELVTTADPTPTVEELLEYNTTYYWRVDFYEGTTFNMGRIWSFTTVPPAPIISGNPVDITVGTGPLTSGQFTVTGSNMEIFTWYKEGQETPLVDGANISGSDTATLTISPVSLADEGNYYCVVSNTLSEVSVQSDSAILLTRRLVAHWAFDGTIADETGVWDGLWTGNATQYVAGVDGTENGAVLFDGASYVEIPGSEDYFTFHPRGISIAMWVRNVANGDTGDYMRILSKAGDYEIKTHDDGYIYGGFTPNQDIGIAGGSTDWRLIVLTFDPYFAEGSAFGNYSIYQGENDQIVSVYGDLTAQEPAGTVAQNVLRIGASSILNQGGLWNLNQAALDDVRIYSYALSLSEIAQLQIDMLGGSICADINAESLIADFNRDCVVDINDFATFAAGWLNNEIIN
ncbi:MAG: immunoglobulin domain-containing protein [Phycisphaerae bacterium]|nr:immunoglobulin domain-containing protein [Phycisphaerae bacterium]